MKKVVCGIGSLIVSSILSTSVSYASLPPSVTQPNTEGERPGTITLNGSYPVDTIVPLSDATGLSGGDRLNWKHTNVSFIGNSTDPVHFVEGQGSLPNGDQSTILDFSLDNVHKDNGYLLADDQDVSGWVTALGGNGKYVAIYDKQEQTTLTDPFSGQSWPMDWLPNVIALCGAKIQYKGGASNEVFQVNSNGNTGTPVFDVIPTPAPQASVSTQPSYSVGDSVPINLTAKLYAAATNWHMEAVHVTGPSGYDKYLPVNTGANGAGPAADGTAFPYYGESGTGSGALATVYGGGSGDPNSPAVDDEKAALDTTGLTPGTYTIAYTLYDAVGRAASNASSSTQGTVTTTFTLNPSSSGNGSSGSGGGSGGGSAPPAPPSNSGVGPVLSMRFHNLPQQVRMGSTFTAPVEISNNSDKSVTTNLKFSLKGSIIQEHVETVTSPCTDANGNQTTCTSQVVTWPTLPTTESITQQITVPAHGVYTWNVNPNLTFNVSGGSPSSWTGTLNAGGVGNSNGVYDSSAKYYPYLVVDAAQPELFTQPEITASIGTNFYAPPPGKPVLTM